jgi:putative ATP-binding cassette transporter
MQTVRAFGQVQDSLSFIVSSSTDIAAWRSVVERLAGFQSALEIVRMQVATDSGIRHTASDGEDLIVSGVDLDLPSGELLVINVNFTGRRARERARSFVLSPVFGLSGAAKSACRSILAFSFFRRSRTCQSGRCARGVSYPMPAGAG